MARFVAGFALAFCGLTMPACLAAEPRSRPVRDLADFPDDDGEMLAITPSGATIVLEVARSPAKRSRGLMFRDEIPAGTGMIFVFEQAARHSFWMLNCRTSLDIVWIDDEFRVVHVGQDLPPCRATPCENYLPDIPARYVIEVAGGAAPGLGLVRGARILLETLPADTER